MTSILVLVPETGQVLMQKNINSSNIPSITYLPLGGTFSYGQRFDVRFEKFRCEHHIESFLPVSEFITIVSVQKNDVPIDDEYNYYINCVIQDFAAGMVLLKGRSELDAGAFTSYDINLHTNRLQRDFQMFSPFFDQLARLSAAPCVLLNTSESVLTDRKKEFVEVLENFTESCECVHACIVIGGKLVCGTNEWFKQIKVAEMRLILAFVGALHEHTASTISDIPIFLPYTNPVSPVRLLKVQLYQEAILCMLCADDVKIQTVINQVDSILGARIDLLQNALHIKERSFPISCQVNAHVQAFCCYSKTTRLSVLSFSPHVSVASEAVSGGSPSRTLDKDTMRTYLCDFIKTNFEMIRMIDSQPLPTSSTEQAEHVSHETEVDPSDPNFENESSELSWVKKNCKVFLLGVSGYIMIVLFDADTPTYPMRSITTSLLETVTAVSDF